MELDAAMWARVNEAIPVYLCAGEMTPKERPERLVEKYGDKAAAELRPLVETIIKEMMSIEIDWKQHNLKSGTDLAASRIWFAHPQLSDAALREMARLFSWSWR